jgi:cell division protein FtsI/penicillin-binding protein 2
VNRLVNRRIRLFLAILTLAFGGLLLRATWLQACVPSRSRPLAQTQHREAVTLPAERGTILRPQRRRARSRRACDHGLRNPMQIVDPRRAGPAVERTLGSTPTASSRRSPIRRAVSSTSTARRIPRRPRPSQRLKLPGFGTYPEERRSYPQGSVAAQVLGYVGIDGERPLRPRARSRQRRCRQGGPRRRSSRTRPVT